MVGAWCFVDHMGPMTMTRPHDIDIAPHPHIGLQTVTWLVAGEIVHRDSLGSEQVIRPGQLNLMTAGHGVAHSEEASGQFRHELHGVQLWVAQPAATRNGPAAFEHHADLPVVDLGGGSSATVLVGALAGAESKARRDTEHVGADLDLGAGRSVVALSVGFEYGVVVLSGAVVIDGQRITPGHLAYLASGLDELVLDADDPARVLLVGGVPFEEQVLMWWNFVARDRTEIEAAYRSWSQDDGRFPAVHSTLPKVEVGPPWWTRSAN
jgi:hypothetical protein